MDDEDVGIDIEEVEAQGADPITQFPEYVPLCKGKAKVPKDIDKSKVPLQTPLLPYEIISEGLHLVRVHLLKREYWDLAGHEKFPHLVSE